MLGSIIGDICGSKYEWENYIGDADKISLSYPEMDFTDDTIMTIAVLDWLQEKKFSNKQSLIDKFKLYFEKYPHRGYGSSFANWCSSPYNEAYNSYGNGSAMRTSFVPLFCSDKQEVLDLSKTVAEVTHNHIEGIKGSQAISLAIFMALNGSDKSEIKTEIETTFNYFLDFDFQELVDKYTFDVTCQGSVPESIYCFLISDNFEDCLRKCIMIGGDTDTICCMAGGIAEAYYKEIPFNLKNDCLDKLPIHLKNVLNK